MDFNLLKSVIKERSFNNHKIEKEIKSFFIIKEINPEYEEPKFSKVEGSLEQKNPPKILLISAAGATGKSALAYHLSATNKIPILDLSKQTPVGANSLSGLLLEIFGTTGISSFFKEMHDGKISIIIDAIDEGYIKTTEEAFNAFLSNIADIADKSDGISFILLGRTQALEHTWLHMSERKINSSLIKIEPFNTEQAKSFIDKKLSGSRNSQYEVTRNYIIDTIGVFFSSRSSTSAILFESFMGYAPVLQAVSTLLKQNNNYHSLLESLKRSEERGIDLIIRIVEYILERERDEKIQPQVLPELLRTYSDTFKSDIQERAFKICEQCARVVSKLLRRNFEGRISDNENFNLAYEKKMAQWIEEHPFLQSGKIQNQIFESYVVATLIESDEYHELAITYLNELYKDKDASQLFLIFDKISKRRIITPDFTAYLYASLKSFDDKDRISQLNIDADTEIEEKSGDVVPIDADVEFNVINTAENKILSSYSYILPVSKNIELKFYGYIGNVFITLPGTVSFQGKRAELIAPVYISCSKINIKTQELNLRESRNSDEIHLECENFEVDFASSQMPTVNNYLSSLEKFKISSFNRPIHPFINFYEKSNLDVDPELQQKYLRFRRIVLTLRSHSKGTLARFKDKIEHRRVLKNDLGRAVLKSLVEYKILILVDDFYHWNPENADANLGVTWTQLRNNTLTVKTKSFLQKIIT